VGTGRYKTFERRQNYLKRSVYLCLGIGSRRLRHALVGGNLRRMEGLHLLPLRRELFVGPGQLALGTLQIHLGAVQLVQHGGFLLHGLDGAVLLFGDRQRRTNGVTKQHWVRTPHN
jgi:hypothetical protein